jgi:hypothetical protein
LLAERGVEVDHVTLFRWVQHFTPLLAEASRKLNRTENLRPIPAGDPDFADLFRTRNDAESINRNLDDTLFLRRAHSVGARRQLVNMLGYALMVNSQTLLEHQVRRGRHGPERQPDLIAA